MSRIVFFILIIIFKPGIFYAEEVVHKLIVSKLELLSHNPETKISGERLHSIEYISNLYAQNDFQPFWTEPGYIEDAITALKTSYEDGLISGDYHLDAILLLQYEIKAIHREGELKASKKADLDLLLTDGVIFYANHLLYGKIDPLALVPTWNFGYSPIPDLNPVTFKQYISKQEIQYRLKELRPDMHLYDTLLASLARYRAIAEKGGWQSIPAGGKIEPGNKDPRIPGIRSRLLITGELSEPDSVSSDLYDKILENDIKAFQSVHALDADGIIGAGTFRELSVPVEKRIEAIRVNLERIRWLAQNMPDSYIIVNIAAFWLVMIKEGQIVHSTAVVVGKPLNKTPIFRDKLRYIEFNPTWTQPTSIVKNETIPKLKKDSTYLEKNHMVLLDTRGNLVPTSNLDMKNLSASRFPYLVRQEPGPWNALGEMKFMFPNKYDIYLHDTPSRSLFSRASRAYSHGCIRVDKPKDLAVKLLEGTEYDRKKIDRVVETHTTTRVNLPEPIDILLLYWTCGIDRNGKLFFVPDIYERDQAVLRDLNRMMR